MAKLTRFLVTAISSFRMIIRSYVGRMNAPPILSAFDGRRCIGRPNWPCRFTFTLQRSEAEHLDVSAVSLVIYIIVKCGGNLNFDRMLELAQS